MPAFRTLVTLLAAVTLCHREHARTATTPRPDCTSAPFRQFDFWVGDWVVTSRRGDTVGTNRVTLEEDGCIVHEHWKGSKGGTGQSFNYFDRQDARWHQIWIDNAGSVLNLAGAFDSLYRRAK